MGTAITPCPDGDQDPCIELADKIEELIDRDKRQEGQGGTHGLKHRFREQIEGINGPPGSGVGDPSVWLNHDKAIREQQQSLRSRLNDFNRNHCGDHVPLPADAWNWATKPAPSAKDWINPGPASQSMVEPEPDKGFMDSISEITGLTGIALIVYVIVSEGSRLFPPRNLIPVP